MAASTGTILPLSDLHMDILCEVLFVENPLVSI